MTDISGKFACSQDREKVSESACPQKADLQQEPRVFCTCSPILFSTSYSSVRVWREVLRTIFFGGEQRGMNRRFFDGSGRDV